MKKSDKAIMNKLSPEETLEKICGMTNIEGNAKSLLKELGEEIIPEYLASSNKRKEELGNKMNKKALELFRVFETRTHVNLVESFKSDYRGLAQELTENIIEEYGCTTSIEKMMAETIVNAFIRIIDNSRRLNNQLECIEITPNRNIYLSILSKQVDRANRQYLSAVMTLKQMKAPSVELSVKATNAFVGNNQQINMEPTP